MLNFSVVVPFYNSEIWLSSLEESFSDNAAFIGEVIIVDDCSRPSSYKILREFCKKNGFRVLRTFQNGGPSAARNLGASEALFEYVAFHDVDDMWVPERLARINAFLSENSQVHFLVNDYVESLQGLDHSVCSLEKINKFRLIVKNYIQPSCLVVKKDSLFFFNEKFRYSEDFCYQLSILKSGIDLYRISAPLTILGRPQGSVGGLSGDLVRMRIGEIAAYREFCGVKLIWLFPFLLSWSITKFVVKGVKGCLVK